ncbi:MAG: hypothetical protein H5T64_11130 [Chloroflexi bacterium]|nr:hypothetical protein [Chloroflexota bacterium]
MLDIIVWWLAITMVGLAAVPLAALLFRRLPSRGYVYARALGLLTIGYAFWMGGSLGVLANHRGTILILVGALTVASSYLARRSGVGWAQLWQEKRALIAVTETLFAVAFLAYLYFRAHDPNIHHTEQPMDFGFINAILRSPRFPPNDQWMSGYAISYYYFGYLIAAMLIKLTGVASGVGYNLSLGSIFSLAVVGAFGLVYDLVAWHQHDNARADERLPLGFGILGGVMTVVVGNLEGFFEYLRAQGWGSPGFWKWLDVPGLAEAVPSGQWFPGFDWWWWRATRIIQDINTVGKLPEVITEFPAFSFILGDSHPHVMALPFAMLALAVALHVLRQASESERPESAPGALFLGHFSAPPLEHLLPLIIGALFFLNSWDFPTYALVVTAAYALGRYRTAGARGLALVADVLGFAAWLALWSVLLYIPFYVGFRSQAGGPKAVFYAKTPLHQYLLIFGFPLYVLVSYAAVRLVDVLRLEEKRQDVLAWFVSNWATILMLALLAGVVLSVVLPRGTEPAAQAARYALLGTPLVPLLALFLGLVAMLAWWWAGVKNQSLSHTYACLLAAVGILVTYFMEFVYIKDDFDARMNTVFKFYYQGWVLFAIAAAFAVYYLLAGRALERGRKSNALGRFIWAMAFVMLFLCTLYYPVAGAYAKAGGFRSPPSLDGAAYVAKTDPAQWAAIRWLEKEVGGGVTVIAEASGDAYNAGHNRVSAWTGIPTILGWANHERQWRGTSVDVGKREAEVRELYTTNSMERLRELLDTYNVQYVYVGPVERERYQVSESMLARFDTLMDRVYDQDGVRIYRRR